MRIIRRTVYYYDLQVYLIRKDEALKGDALRECIDMALSLDSTLIEEGITIDKYPSAKRYFFGSIGRNKDLSNDPLARARDEKDLSTKPIPTGTKFEFFTFFLIDFETARVTLLHSYDAPALKRYLCHYLMSNKFITIECARMPAISVDLQSRIGSWQNLTELRYAVSPQSITFGVLPGISLLRNADEYKAKGLRVSVKIEGTGVSGDMIKALEDFDHTEMSSIVVVGHNENGIPDTYDLIEKILTKKSIFTLENNALKNRDIVYAELIKKFQEL